ncbi:MAG TPA: DUF559 domain-containing protein [Abditibacteriaceae bacterium]|nr:DUF559 domain-containing protein [Abditibacteriaceae bacterium]
MSTLRPRKVAYAVAPSQQVLVAWMPDRRDFAIARDEHWYRIPVKSAPSAVVADCIGFYHSQAFGEQAWGVHYCAQIKKRQIVKRIELLPGEPHHPRAEADYYRLELGELQHLVRPILSRRQRRVIFLPTTLHKFETATELNDLFHESPLEDDLWEAFKRQRIEAERQLFIAVNQARYRLDFALFCEKGQIDVECDGDQWHSRRADIASDNARNNALTSSGWSVLRFSTQEVHEGLSECLKLVRRTIAQQGGLAALRATAS